MLDDSEFLLCNVLYVPKLKKNLLSKICFPWEKLVVALELNVGC